jgi:glycosidase
MKIKILIILGLWAIFGFGCKQNQAENTETVEKVVLPPEWVHNAVLYEVNIRQHTQEGSFEAFEKDLPRLKKLGVTALWFMPIQPIGEKNRKAVGDTFVHDMPNPDYMKYWGSYYSIKDYTDVNPRYGIKEDFKRIVEWCHKNEMKVMLDWVANHTAWDHEWISKHPDWYTTDAKGNITDPIGADGKSWGWTDVADLNYDSKEMRLAMIEEMKFWVKEFNIDGFRCDVANEVPTDFWNEATVELQKLKPLFMLAEAETHQPDQFDSAFHSYYGWEMHHAFNKAYKNEANATYFQRIVQLKDSINGHHVFPLNFITNHDENSWNGTIHERLGASWRAMGVLSYFLRGIPLLYTGQDAGLKHRLKFFEKDSIDWKAKDAGTYFDFYQKMNQWKTQNAALSVFSPLVFDSEYENKNFVIFTRGEKEQLKVCVNISSRAWGFSGHEIDISAGYQIADSYNLLDDGILGAWGYVIMTQK